MTKQGDNRSALELAIDSSVSAITSTHNAGKKFRKSVIDIAAAAASTSAAKSAVCTVLTEALRKLSNGKDRDQCIAEGVYSTLRYAGQLAAKALDVNGHFKSVKGGVYEFVAATEKAKPAAKTKGAPDPSVTSDSAGDNGPTTSTLNPEQLASPPEFVHLAADAHVAKAPECPADAIDVMVARWSEDAVLAAFVAKFKPQLRKAVAQAARTAKGA